MEQRKYNEFKVLMADGKIAEKMPTARKSVMIYEHDAERMNKVSGQTKMYYELAKKPQKEEDGKDADSKDDLWEQINKLVEDGKIEKPHHATGDKKLIEIINNNK